MMLYGSFACKCGALIDKDYHAVERIIIQVSNYYRWTCGYCGQQFIEKMADTIDLTPYGKQYGVTDGFTPIGLPTLEKVLKELALNDKDNKKDCKNDPKLTNGSRKSKK